MVSSAYLRSHLIYLPFLFSKIVVADTLFGLPFLSSPLKYHFVHVSPPSQKESRESELILALVITLN